MSDIQIKMILIIAVIVSLLQGFVDCLEATLIKDSLVQNHYLEVVMIETSLKCVREMKTLLFSEFEQTLAAPRYTAVTTTSDFISFSLWFSYINERLLYQLTYALMHSFGLMNARRLHGGLNKFLRCLCISRCLTLNFNIAHLFFFSDLFSSVL